MSTGSDLKAIQSRKLSVGYQEALHRENWKPVLDQLNKCCTFSSLKITTKMTSLSRWLNPRPFVLIRNFEVVSAWLEVEIVGGKF
jgi:hypothetical protein